MRTVLVAMDESEASQRVATFVNRFFEGEDLDLLVLSVARTAIPWMPTVGYGAVGIWPGAISDDQFRAMQEVQDEEARRAATGSGVEDADEAVVASGEPVSAILRAAAERGADLVIVGSSHKGFLQRAVQGSVSEDLVRAGEVPVLVVP